MEVELFAGLIEALAGDPTAAEGHLRTAYAGLADMGVGADAALAAALLARALLDQGRTDEAEALAAHTAGSAGQGLQASIAWRTVRARLLAAAGDHEGAATEAEGAVALAAGTDLLLDHADAWATLADVRTQTGDQSGARMARAEADRLYAAKGSTLHSPGERTLVSDPGPPAPPSGSGAGSAENLASRKADNLATRRAHEYIVRWAERGPDAVRDLLSEDLRWEDHRQGLTAVEDGIDANIAGLAVITELLDGERAVIHEVLAVRGEHLALARGGVTGPYEAESLSL